MEHFLREKLVTTLKIKFQLYALPLLGFLKILCDLALNVLALILKSPKGHGKDFLSCVINYCRTILYYCLVINDCGKLMN